MAYMPAGKLKLILLETHNFNSSFFFLSLTVQLGEGDMAIMHFVWHLPPATCHHESSNKN
jgi:hypothetical protein